MQDLVTSKQVQLIDSAQELFNSVLNDDGHIDDLWLVQANRWLNKYNEFNDSLTDGSVVEAEF